MDLLEKKAFESSAVPLSRHPWELARERIIKEVIKKNFPTSAPHLLDVGCGDGYIISSIARAFPQGTFQGIDIALSEIDTKEMDAQAPSNLHFFNELQQCNTATNEINGFTLMDVLEHVPDDVAVLNDLTNLSNTKSGSLYFITVPAWQFLSTDHDVFLKHFRRYTKKSLAETIRKSNLEKIEIHYFFFSLFLARLLKNIVSKLRNKEEAIDSTDLLWKHGKSITDFIVSILYAEYKVMRLLSKVGIHIPGLSVFGLCKKQ